LLLEMSLCCRHAFAGALRYCCFTLMPHYAATRAMKRHYYIDIDAIDYAAAIR